MSRRLMPSAASMAAARRHVAEVQKAEIGVNLPPPQLDAPVTKGTTVGFGRMLMAILICVFGINPNPNPNPNRNPNPNPKAARRAPWSCSSSWIGARSLARPSEPVRKKFQMLSCPYGRRGGHRTSRARGRRCFGAPRVLANGPRSRAALMLRAPSIRNAVQLDCGCGTYE